MKRPLQLVLILTIFALGGCRARFDQIDVTDYAGLPLEDMARALVAVDNLRAYQEVTESTPEGWVPTGRFVSPDEDTLHDDLANPFSATLNEEAAFIYDLDSEFRETPKVYAQAVTQRHDHSLWSMIDALSLVSFPVTLLIEAGRYTVLEDADSIFRPTTYDTFVLSDPAEPAIGSSERFEVVVRTLAIDNFTEGRLRDGLGGSGGDLSLQLSLQALTEKGKPFSEDVEFLVSEERKRRSPVLAALKATSKGREFVEDFEGRARQVRAAVETLTRDGKLEKNVEELISELLNDSDVLGKYDLSGAVNQIVTGVRTRFLDKLKLEKVIGDALADRVREEIDKLEDDVREATTNERIEDLVKKLAKPIAKVLSEVEPLLMMLQRYGVDDAGLYEQVEVIKGLADADRLVSLEFESIRPSAMDLAGLDSLKTAAVVFNGNVPRHANDAAEVWLRLGDSSAKLGEEVTYTDSKFGKLTLVIEEAKDLAEKTGLVRVSLKNGEALAAWEKATRPQLLKELKALYAAVRANGREFADGKVENVLKALQLESFLRSKTLAKQARRLLKKLAEEGLDKIEDLADALFEKGLTPTETAARKKKLNTYVSALTDDHVRALYGVLDAFLSGTNLGRLLTRGGELTSSVAGADTPSKVAITGAKPIGKPTQFERGVVFRGNLDQLSKHGKAAGFSLSTLMLERDSDKVAAALYQVESYARDKDLSVNVYGADLEVAPIVEALATIADEIAQDDVELKSIDLRFATGQHEEGSTPGKRVFVLRPCQVLVARNFYGAADFGAAVLVEIRSLDREPTTNDE